VFDEDIEILRRTSEDALAKIDQFDACHTKFIKLKSASRYLPVSILIDKSAQSRCGAHNDAAVALFDQSPRRQPLQHSSD
jgi:hypothetical protein